MRIAIVYRERRIKKVRTVEFHGTHAERDGFNFIAYNQPVEVIAIRREHELVDLEEENLS
jgi:hypothetical protein